MVRETRHLWVGNLPENVREEKIIEHFKRYGRVESVKVLPKRGSEGGVAAFVDFVDIKSAQNAHNSINKMGDRDLRTDYNEPGTMRGLDNSLSLGSHGRDVSGFTRAAGGLVYGPPALIHSREGRYERRLDGTAENRDREYDHSAYGHHERADSSFDRQRHYDSDYYRDTRERTLNTGSGGGGAVSTGVGGGVVGSGASACGTGAVAGGSGGSSSVGVGFHRSHSRSPRHFDTAEPQYETCAREPFILPSIVHRDLYQEERGRRGDRSYHNSRSRSPHSSHSRNLSPQRLASQASWPPHSHSGSGSLSRSSSSNCVSSTSSSGSSDSSSSSSDDSPARSVQSAAVPAPSALPLSALDKDEPRKSFGINVQNLPVRSTDTSLKDGLFHEFKKYGKVTSVQIHGALEERYGLVFFRQQEDQENALGASKGKLFFGMQIEVIVWNGPGASTTETESENEFRPLDERIDEFHPKATRTLFIGNLEKTTSYHDLLNIFQHFGEIVDIDIKKVNGAPQYAFLQYCDIASVCKAITKMDGEYLCHNRLKLGFGKCMPTTCVWLDGLASNITEQYLTRHFCRYGHVVKVVFDRPKGMALILYNNIEYAQAAVKETKGWKIGGNKIKVDFASQESQMSFYRSMQASGQDIRDFYEILSERMQQYEFTAERPFFDNSVRTPGGALIEDPRRKLPARGCEFYTEWDPYQGDFYDPRYFDDPREYRDPYEQDIRKYSYLQRERERERFETDREHDHGRRTIEQSQSPSHPNRPASPTVSSSLSERLPSDSDRRICCRSSEQSGSCSSLSPPRFDKACPDRYNKSDKPEKERSFEAECGIGGEKEKRAGRKEKGEKEKGEKQRMRKFILQCPSIPSPVTDPELEREGSPGLRSKISKFPPKEKEGSAKGQLDLPPCVVQLTRVKEKEGKLLGHAVLEKQRLRDGNDSIWLASPTSDQNSPPFHIDPQKGDIIKHRKVPKDKNMTRLVEVGEYDGKMKAKKHMKPGPGFDGSNSVDVDRLAARKRRFEESMLKTDRLKRASQEEEEAGRLGFRKPDDSAMAKENESLLQKGVHKKEHRKDKSDRLVTVCSPKNKQESDIVSMGMGLGLSLELQSRLGEPTEDATDPLDPPCLKIEFWGSKIQRSSSLMKISDGSLDHDSFKVQPQEDNGEQNIGLYTSRGETEERLASDIEHSQSCKKQLWQKLEEPDKSDKPESRQGSNTEDFERRSLLHEVGKPPQDITDDSPSNKRNKSESLDFDLLSAKRELHYRSSWELNEDLGRSVTAFSGSGHFPSNEECASELSQSFTNKETKDSPKEEDKVYSHVNSLKYSLDMTHDRLSSPNTEFPKSKTTLLGCDEQLLQRWESRIKSDSLRMDMTFPSSIVKRESICKRLVRELEPGEVQSDSDNDGENKNFSPKTNTSLSSILRDREERLTDLKFSGSLEKNKFYSFALDKTITPDTKALLERAKSLSSSREDNWSFLDRDSRFASLRSSSDKEKVESAPRPIPSWYMKKKKIRTDSEGKLDDKKEDPKAEDQQRQELFASRFLHSSIFEQDSRRLKHLERKDPDPKVGFGRHLSKQDSFKGQPEPGGVDLQEPIVLFHSRFLELQQQKETSRDHFPPEIESVHVVDEGEGEQVQNEQQEWSPKVSEFMQKADIKSVSPPLILPISVFLPSPREILPQQEKEAVLTSSSEQAVSMIKEEIVEHNCDVSPPQSSPLVEIQPRSLIVITPLRPVLLEGEVKVEPKAELCEHKVKTITVDHASFFDDKPPTPGASLRSFEAEAAKFLCSASPKIEENVDIVKMEVQPEKPDSKDFDTPQKSEASQEVHKPVSEAEMKPAKPIRKQPKSKRAKPNVSVTQILKPPESVVSEKPVTRKSERIDREKLKRSSSPRGEISSESITTAKSPVHALDSENESSLMLGRIRRRNVRSVYATPSEGEAQPPGKEVVEYSRATSKRSVDKEQVQQDALNTSTNTRRGRPPKSHRRGGDVSAVKGYSQKTSEEDIDIKEPVNTGTSVGRKASRVDKQSESATSPGEKSGDGTNTEEPEPKIKDESEEAGKLLEEAKKCLPTKKDEKDKELTDQIAEKSSEGDIERTQSTHVEKGQQSEKSGKVKAPRLTQNAKLVTEDKSNCLRNLEIRVSVDDVKGLLCSGEDESESFEATAKKTKPGVPDKEETRTQYLKEAAGLSPEEKEILLDSEPPMDPAVTLLAHQIELERAVENIAKLTVEKPLQPYKEPPAEPRTLLPPVTVQPENEMEGEKSANPASETELAAAIDSITAEDISTDTDGFIAPPTYTALVPTPEPLVSPSANEVLEPETHIIDADPEMGVMIPSAKPLLPDTKASESSVSGASAQDDSPPPETPKKTGKAVRAKTPKRFRGRKACANRKGENAEEVPEMETSPIKLTECIPEDMEIINSKAATATAAATAAVVTAAATCKHDITCTMTVDTPEEAEQHAVEQPVPEESAFHSSTSPPHLKKLQLSALAPALSPSLALTPSPTQLNVPPPRPGKMPVSPDWLPRSEGSRIHATPAIQVNLVTPSAPAVTALGNQSANPPMPPDTKASDIDPSSSTLRKILMEPKYVSASNSNAIPTTVLTTTLADLRMSESENSSDTMTAWHKHLEDRPSPFIPHPTFQKPSPPTETQQNFGEKMHSVIFSPTTSVISRIPMPYDTEEAPRISLSNRNAGLSLPKQKFRSSMNENSRYHGVDVVEDVNSRGWSVVESTPYNTDSSPGLRVNTSQGVVVLSYSGKKTEGLQRISAKISQIPPASAVDIEFQQSVSKSQIKQEPLTPSQPSTPKGPLTPTGYGHPGVLLTGQSYNSQPIISTIKQESPGSDKSESSYYTGLQGSTVMMIQQKMIQQPVTSHQVLMYNQAVVQQHTKKGPGVESIPMMTDMAKANQTSNLSLIMNPHHPSLTGNRMSPSPSTPTDQSVPHLKQEPYSPRTTGHLPSPVAKVCPPSNSMSPHGSSMVLHPGMPEMSLYISSMHHPHPEKSVIMTPVSHSVTQSVSMGRPSHGKVRMNTLHLSGMNYGRRADFLPSSHTGSPQRSNMPVVIRDMVVQSHAGPTRGASDRSAKEDIRHYHQGLCRSSATQLQSDVMMMQAEQQRGLHQAGLRLDQYSMASRDIRDIRDMRILMHHQLGEHTITEGRQSRTPEAGVTSITNISAASKSPLVGKGMMQMGKETPKPLEANMSHPPHTESSRIMGVQSSVPVMVSPHHHPQGVQLIHPGGAGSFPVCRDIQGFHSQFSSHSSMGFNLASHGITPSQDGDLGHRGKLSQSLSAGSLGGGCETKSNNSHLLHTASMDLSHMPRMQRDTISSCMALSHKQELVLQKGPPVFMSSRPAAPLSSSSELRPEGKLGHSGYRTVDMVQLLTKYPIVWQGLLALKNDSAAVQLHFVSGNNVLAHHSLPPLEGGAPLRIAQRMRMEASQLEGVARRMMVESDYCLLLALPCGRDQEDVLSQTLLLKGGFITYLQQKQAAGIINVPIPGSNQPAYVVQIFPPCEFSESHLSRLAPDLLNSISSISPHLMIVIASV